jgi:chromosome segregation ATPase
MVDMPNVSAVSVGGIVASNSAQTVFAEIQGACDKLANLTRLLVEAQGDLDDLKDQLKALKATNYAEPKQKDYKTLGLFDDTSAFNSAHGAWQELQNQIAALQTKVSEQEGKVSTLQDQVSAADSALSYLENTKLPSAEAHDRDVLDQQIKAVRQAAEAASKQVAASSAGTQGTGGPEDTLEQQSIKQQELLKLKGGGSPGGSGGLTV